MTEEKKKPQTDGLITRAFNAACEALFRPLRVMVERRREKRVKEYMEAVDRVLDRKWEEWMKDRDAAHERLIRRMIEEKDKGLGF